VTTKEERAEHERVVRCAAIDAAILTVLRDKSRTPGGVGRRVFQGSAGLTAARALGRLLALRKEGKADGKVDGARPGACKWHITEGGMAWLREVMALPQGEADR